MATKIYFISQILFQTYANSTLAKKAAAAPTKEQKIQDPKESILLLQSIIRHGARAPIQNYIDPTKFKVDWLKHTNPGDLTLLGYRQEYMSGKLFQQEYPDFFTNVFSNSECQVRSTGFNRTIQSAAGHLTGIFDNLPPQDKHDFPVSDSRVYPPNSQLLADKLYGEAKVKTQYMLHPIYSVAQKDDFFLGGHDKICVASWIPHLVRVMDHVKAQPKMFENLQGLGKILKERFQITQTTATFMGGVAFELQDIFQTMDGQIQDYSNNPEPQLNASNPKDKIFIDKLFMWNSWLLDVQQFYGYHKLSSTGYLQKIKENILEKSNAYKNKTLESSKLKFYLLSAHDITIANALPQIMIPTCFEESFNNPKFLDEDFDPKNKCRLSPPQASKLVFELVELSHKKELKVRVRYNGEYLNYCELESNDGGKWECDVSTFSAKIDTITMPDTWEQMCKGSKDDFYILDLLEKAHKYLIVGNLIYLRYEEWFVQLGVIWLAHILKRIFCCLCFCGCLRSQRKDKRSSRDYDEEVSSEKVDSNKIGVAQKKSDKQEVDQTQTGKKSKKDKKKDQNGQDPLEQYKQSKR